MDNKYKPVPFWSWNDELDEKKLTDQIEWMHESGIGGFFMHARGGLTTPYLGEKWFSCVDACLQKAKELNMEAYAYDENGWPSGFAGGKLLENEEDRDCYLSYQVGTYDEKAFASYDISGEKLKRVYQGTNVLNVYCHSSPSTADICNKKTVRKFINLTHEQYKKADKYNNLRGFFTDEPQYQRWNHAYTHCLEEFFKDKYDIDIKDQLGLMFVEKEGYRAFRYKYWKAMQELMLTSFAEQIYNWCDENNYKLTGHYVEETCLNMQMQNNGGIMPFYAFEHIPGMDLLGRNIYNDLSTKQLGSVAAQFGKKQILTESFAMVGWDATPEELKHLFEWQAVTGGVSLLCHHLLPYSEYGQRKRDYPEHYSAINPWAEKNFSLFNDEVSSIGEKISNSTEEVHIGVMHPIRSCYFNYKRDKSWESVSELEQNIADVVDILGAKHLPYHFIDETLLARYGKVIGNKIVIGHYGYDTILFPLIYTMDITTDKILKEFVANGGKVLFMYDKPAYLEGEPHNYDYLNTNITFDQVIESAPFESSENKNIRISYRRDDNTGKYFFYIVNLGEETEFVLNDKKLKFKKWESRFVDVDKLKDDAESVANYITFNPKFVLSKPVNNYLTLDMLSYSKDGINYSNTMYHLCAFDELLNARYDGQLFLKYTFKIKKIPANCNAIIENQHIENVLVNGKEAKKVGTVLEENVWKYDIHSLLKIGDNEIIVKINYYQNKDVYYALFGENVTESLRNCLAYPTTIEAIFLSGEFGVFGDIAPGRESNTLVGKDFYIDEQKQEVSSLIKDGFPFFRGAIELEQTINVTDENTILSIPDRYAMIQLFINDVDAGKYMFSHNIDISAYVKKGENKIKLILIVSNRNLLGPFHNAQIDEPLCIGPFSFERKGAWINGKCDSFRDEYAFVKTIL